MLEVTDKIVEILTSENAVVAAIFTGIGTCISTWISSSTTKKKIENERIIALRQLENENSSFIKNIEQRQAELEKIQSIEADKLLHRIKEVEIQSAEERRMKLIDHARAIDDRISECISSFMSEIDGYVHGNNERDIKKLSRLRWDIWGLLTSSGYSITGKERKGNEAATQYDVNNVIEWLFQAYLDEDKERCEAIRNSPFSSLRKNEKTGMYEQAVFMQTMTNLLSMNKNEISRIIKGEPIKWMDK